jgi:Ca2+-binding EF-hand superfamily protein
MKLRMLAASAVTLAALMSAAPSIAYAQSEAGFRFEELLKMADKNKDGMVTKQEFLDAMGKMYDKGMAKMKNDAKMVKGGMMTMDGVRALLADIYKGA